MIRGRCPVCGCLFEMYDMRTFYCDDCKKVVQRMQQREWCRRRRLREKMGVLSDG